MLHLQFDTITGFINIS